MVGVFILPDYLCICLYVFILLSFFSFYAVFILLSSKSPHLRVCLPSVCRLTQHALFWCFHWNCTEAKKKKSSPYKNSCCLLRIIKNNGGDVFFLENCLCFFSLKLSQGRGWNLRYLKIWGKDPQNKTVYIPNTVKDEHENVFFCDVSEVTL